MNSSLKVWGSRCFGGGIWDENGGGSVTMRGDKSIFVCELKNMIPSELSASMLQGGDAVHTGPAVTFVIGLNVYQHLEILTAGIPEI